MKPRSLISGPSSRGIARTLFLLFITMLAAMPLHLPRPAEATAASQPRTALALQERLSAINAYVEQERQAARVPGIGLAIVQGDQVVHLQGFGEADPSASWSSTRPCSATCRGSASPIRMLPRASPCATC
jgi:CubicO group peptidase (beta-lactamase class C family)